MGVRIAIPEPTGGDGAYNDRSLPEYVRALEAAGAEAVVIRLGWTQAAVAQALAGTQGVLLPGSGADVDPEVYGEARLAACGEADPARAAVDELLIQDAFNLYKPVLGICYGVQSVNAWCGGTLWQDLPSQVGGGVNHAPGRAVTQAHGLVVAAGSRLAGIVDASGERSAGYGVPGALWVNSSHHQAVKQPGGNLAVVASAPEDGVVEALELVSAEHFVLGVQWHPERTVATSALSRQIFKTLVAAAESWSPRRIEESVGEAGV